VPITKIAEINGVEAMMIPLGQIMATSMIPLFLTHVGTWQMVYQIISGVTLVMALIWFVIGKDTPQKDHPDRPVQTAQKVSVVRVLKHPVILLAGLCVIGTASVSAATFSFWPTFAIEHFHYSLTTTGFILSLTPIGSVLSSILIPWISKKIGVEKPLIWIWGFLMPIFYYLMLSSSNTLIVAMASFLAGFGSMAFVPLLLSYVFRIREFSAGEITLGVGIYNICVAIGLGLGPLVISQIFQYSQDLGLALKIGCLAPLALAIGGLFLPEQKIHA
jgi:predicted MFS family arabinose efflux permease